MQVTYAWGRGRHGVLAREDDQDAPVEAPVTVNGDLVAVLKGAPHATVSDIYAEVAPDIFPAGA